MHVVPGDFPLLLSLESLWRARAVLDLEADTLFLKETRMNFLLRRSKAGHLALVVFPGSRPSASSTMSARAAGVKPARGSAPTASPPAIAPGLADLPAVATRLYRIYGHAGAARLSHMLRTAGCEDVELHTAVSAAVHECRACQRAQPAPHHPDFALPLSTRFNESVAMDLASIRGLGTFVHFIDLGTRLSR